MDYSRCLPDISYAVNRIATTQWTLDDIVHNNNCILLYDGCAHVQINDNEYEAKKYDLVYFKNNDKRYCHTYKDNLMHCYSLSFDLWHHDRDSNIMRKIDLPLETIEHISDTYTFEKILTLFKRIIGVWFDSSIYKDYYIRQLFYELLIELLKLKNPVTVEFEKERKVHQVKSYIDKKINDSLINNEPLERIQIKDISNLVEVSPSYISRIFKEVTLTTIIDYTNSHKINIAKELLHAGNTPSYCANVLGYSDIYYFSKQFKKIVGVSPRYFTKSTI